MEFEFQQPTFSINNGAKYSNEDDKVLITLFSSSELKNKVESLQLEIPIYRTLLTLEGCCEGLVDTLLRCTPDIPPTFLNGNDCDMVQKLSRMICDSTMQSRHGVHIDNLFVFIMVSKYSCHYNVVNSSDFSMDDQQVLSHELVQSLACESSVYSLPAGASAIKKLEAQDYMEGNCAICLEGFFNGNEGAKLPCSHVYHCHCVLEWFVQSGTCPICRLPCTQTL